jgi:hypothetical protein
MPNDTAATAAKEDLTDDLGDDGSLVVEDTPFAIVPEWVITADLSDAAFRRLLPATAVWGHLRVPHALAGAARPPACTALLTPSTGRYASWCPRKSYGSSTATTAGSTGPTGTTCAPPHRQPTTPQPEVGGKRTSAATSELAAGGSRKPVSTP